MSIENLVQKINQQYLEITGIKSICSILEKGESHIPSVLENGKQGVYVFFKDNICFKVGKAGPKSKARWNSHHYNLDLTTPSTMTKSIMKDLESFKRLFDFQQSEKIDNFRPDNIKTWVRSNICRIEFKIDAAESKFSLGLLESLVQYHFNPVFERTTNYSNRIKFN
tara:strand:+ start:7554 stop:8054 length:501 start_codon:yes stop_codon:yes gene_type:complete